MTEQQRKRALRTLVKIQAHIEAKPQRVFRYNRIANLIWFMIGGSK